MVAFLRGRALTSGLSLLVVIFAVFFLARLTGSPANLYLPLNASAEDRAAFEHQHGFDRPLYEQFFSYLSDVVRFDLGESLRTTEPAGEMVMRAFPETLKLAFVTMVLAIALAVLIGSLAAYRPNSVFDRMASLTSTVSASMPDFWFAIIGVLVLSVGLGLLPTSGSLGASAWVLPVLTLLLRPFGVLVQVVRGAMVSSLQAPYVKTARSKGVSESKVVFGHALRNVALPGLTVAGDLAVGLVNGAVVVETVFGWPGIGKLMIDSILERDFAVLQAAVLVTALAIFLLNVLIDIAYLVLDPRVRHAQ